MQVSLSSAVAFLPNFCNLNAKFVQLSKDLMAARNSWNTYERQIALTQ